MKFPPRHIETKDVELLLAELWDFSRAWAGIHSQDSRGRDPHFGSGAERGWVRHLWKDEDLPCLRPPLSTEVKNESVVPSPLKQVPCRRETPESWSGKLVADRRGGGGFWRSCAPLLAGPRTTVLPAERRGAALKSAPHPRQLGLQQRETVGRPV